MNYATTLLPQFNRKDYKGRTDKFALQSMDQKLTAALQGVNPVDVTGSVLSDSYVRDSATRLADYKCYWNFYSGHHFQVEYDGGHKKTYVNFCKAVVDKRANWLAGRGFCFYPEKGNELVADVYERVWAANGGKSLIRKTGKLGLSLGDAFWYFSVRHKDVDGLELPKDKWSVMINQINPNFCFPIWTENDPQTMKAFIMQFPIMVNDTYVLFTAIMTASTIEFFKGSESQGKVENPLGVIPVVHIPSGQVGDQLFGVSAIKDVIPLNEAYNDTLGSIRKIVRYHGEPTTVVYGARLSQMERGANKVWSNLPPPNEARVENLELKSDLKAIFETLHDIETNIYIQGKTPKISFESIEGRVSNTSGLAIQLLFEPLVEATIEEQDAYSIGIQKGNKIIRAIHQNIFGEDLALLADSPDTVDDIKVVWKSLLPKDEQVELDNAQKKVALGVWSKAEAARQLSGVSDTEKLALELGADAAYDLAIVAEKQRALNGERPNFTAVGLSSIFLSEDLIDTIKKIGDITGNADQTAG